MAVVIYVVWQWQEQQGKLGFVTYLKLANGENIRLEGNTSCIIGITPTFQLTTPGGEVITEIWQQLCVNPEYSGAVDPEYPNATISYLSHEHTWIEYPSGANLNQVAPTWWTFDSFEAPVNETTEVEYGAHWYASDWSSAMGQEPSGTYRVEIEMTIMGAYEDSTEEATAYGGMQVVWTQDTLTLSVGWQGYSNFILG